MSLELEWSRFSPEAWVAACTAAVAAARGPVPAPVQVAPAALRPAPVPAQNPAQAPPGGPTRLEILLGPSTTGSRKVTPWAQPGP